MIILRNLWRRRTRTLLTWVGITIGITAIVTLTAIAEGFLSNYSEVMASSDGDLALQAKQEAGASIDFAEAMISDRYAEELTANPEVRAIASMLYTIVPMPGVPYFVLFGHEPDGFAIGRFKVTAGQSLRQVQRVAGKPIMLGKVAADSLNKSVGDTVTIYSRTYRVVGIYETGSVMEDGGAVVSVEEVQRLTNKPNAVHSFWIQLERPDRLKYVQERLQERYPELQVVRSGDTRGTAVWLELVRPFTWAVALIAALVGGVGMMNATLMSVFERTREIGVLRALGWRGGQVLLMILGESLVLSIAGAASGSLLSAVLISLLGRVPAMAGLTRGSLSPSLLGQALATALVLGSVGGLYPAWQASRLRPVEALPWARALGRHGAGWPSATFSGRGPARLSPAWVWALVLWPWWR
jgi:ABC-type antimicrobial peptide transport system permease subunit